MFVIVEFKIWSRVKWKKTYFSKKKISFSNSISPMSCDPIILSFFRIFEAKNETFRTHQGH